jgi:UDP-N-acetylglucosamine 2-epimerase
VVRVGHDAEEIADAIRQQMDHETYPSDHLFGDGTAGAKIADVLATYRPAVQKKLHYDLEALTG